MLIPSEHLIANILYKNKQICMTVNCHVTSGTEMACTRVTTAHLSGIVEIVIYDFFFNVHG